MACAASSRRSSLTRWRSETESMKSARKTSRASLRRFAFVSTGRASILESGHKRKWLNRARNDVDDPLQSSPRLEVAGELDNCVYDGAGRNGEHARNKTEVYAQLRTQ
jgi:hypothetical protein